MVSRIYVEKKPGFDVEAQQLKGELTEILGIKGIEALRIINRYDVEGIDEELLIASIGRRKQDGTLYRAQEPPVPAPEEESVPETEPPPTASPSREKVQKDIARRKRQEDDYSGLFLRRNEIKTRQCVYISRDVHSKILKIVNDIAGREISVGGYVDTVLRQHLEQHKEKINELYKKQREDLI